MSILASESTCVAIWSNNSEGAMACSWRVCCVCWDARLISCDVVALCEYMCPSSYLSIRGMLEYDGWLQFVECGQSFGGTFPFLQHSSKL